MKVNDDNQRRFDLRTKPTKATTELEHCVYGVQPRNSRPEFVAAFREQRWQWAMKLQQYLIDQDWKDVRIDITVPIPQPRRRRKSTRQ